MVALALTALMLMKPRPAQAQPAMPRGEATLTANAGYARLVLTFAEPMDAQVRISGNILIVGFRRPVDVRVDRLGGSAPDWVSVARRDPDGRGLRLALSRKLKPHFVNAGERLFIDLLPDSWTGPPPGLPQDVVEELARRTRDAEAIILEKARLAETRQTPATRVRVAVQPTFTRYVFELPELTGVATERGKDRLSLSFAAPLRFDLAEARLNQPPAVGLIEETRAIGATAVTLTFTAPVDLRTFREDSSFIVDVVPIEARPSRAEAAKDKPIDPVRLLKALAPPAEVDAPETVAAKLPPAARPSLPMPMPLALEPAPEPAVAPKAEIRPEARREAKIVARTESKPEPPPIPSEPPVAAAQPPPAAVSGATAVAVARQGDALRLSIPFKTRTPAAVFIRGETLWMVFDTPRAIDVAALVDDPAGAFRSPTVSREDGAQVLRVKLDRPRLASLAAEGAGWIVTLADAASENGPGLSLTRNLAPSRTLVSIAFESARTLHWLSDPEVGDMLAVVTGDGPARGLPKTQSFIEFSALMSAHGVVVARQADDLTVTIAGEAVEVARPGGLLVSDGSAPRGRYEPGRGTPLDSQLWGFDRQADFGERQLQLIRATADAPGNQRAASRLDLARFYLARDMYPEAKAVLDVAIMDQRPSGDDANALVLRVIANVLLDRPLPALKDLANPALSNNNDAAIWRAAALTRQGKWTEARDAFRQAEAAMPILPIELQRLLLRDSTRAAIEAGDFATGSIKLNDFDTMGVPRELQPSVAVLAGRVKEGLGETEGAIASYRLAAESADRPSASQGKLRELVLRYARGDIARTEAIDELETLTTTWRGDDTEVESLQMLARLYTEESRFREAFFVMRTVLRAHPHSEITRRIYDSASETFDSLFLAGRGDALPAIEAVSLFYDFRELTPIGRRGDEMIRRLADRLVAVDLLDQAADLLQHQVENRLQGAARAQVATRLAVVYLLNQRPERAQAILRQTRASDLSNELRNQRVLLETRALSDQGRHDLALEVIASMDGPEAARLRADILWASQRWQAAAEQIEFRLAARWRDFRPLTDAERADVLRAALGFALAEDTIGLGRLRERYGAKMAEGPDQRSFALIGNGLGNDSSEFREVARAITSADTLDGFLRDMRARYPDMSATVAAAPAAKETVARPVPAARETTGSVTERKASRPPRI